MKIVAITVVSCPYLVARYRRFAEMNPQHDLTLLELGRVSKNYAWVASVDEVPYRRVVLSERPRESDPALRQASLVFSALAELQPQVLVVCGYIATGMLAALLWAQSAGRHVPVVMLSASTEDDRVRIGWREKIKERVISQCGSALVGGTRQHEYMRKLRMPDARIFAGYNVVDNDYFWNGAQAVREAASQWRERLGLPERFFLTSARFLRSDSELGRVKNLDRLLEAYARYRGRSAANAWKMVILGDGPLRSELEAQIGELGLAGQVVLPGFRQYPELPLYYGLAGAFVLASVKDTWGLVVNEAMAAGLPVLVSDRCGCVPDLVEEGRNGYRFDPYDVAALANRMGEISSDACDRGAMGRASREIIGRWTPETFAEGLAQAVDAALAAPRPRLGWVDKALLWALSLR